MKSALVAAALLLAACEGAVGTIDVELVSAPGVDPLAGVTTVRLRLDEPPKVVESTRDGSGGFELELEVTAKGTGGFVTFEGLDADGNVIAWGRSGALPIAAIDAVIRIYVAAPASLAAAPVTLDPPRSAVRGALLPFGVLWAGGRDADGAPLDALTIYNVYAHEFQDGEPLPEARAGITAGAGLFDYVYLFGGEDADGASSGDFWRFDTQAPPAGEYLALSGDPELARSGAHSALLGSELLLVTGAPGVLLDGSFGRATAIDTAAPLDGVPATLVLDQLGVETIVAGAAGVVLFDTGEWIELDAPAAARRTGHGVVNLPNGDALIVGGEDDEGPLASAVLYDRDERSFRVIEGFLATPRRGAAIARAGARILIAGGIDADGVVLDDAELFDATTLMSVGVIPLVVPRAGADAAPLGNGQILLAGGTDTDGAPIGTIELFTP